MYDCIVVGSGPAGMSATLYLVRFGRKVAVLEAMTYGGQMLLTAEVENIPGIKEIKGYEMADAMKAQLDAYSYDYLTEKVIAIQREEQHFSVSCASGKTLQSKTVIVASGARYKQAGIPMETEFTGRGISYCALCDGNFYRNKDVVVVGGGNSALEEALYLSRIVKTVHLVHRRDAFRAAQLYVDKAKAAENIVLHLNSVVEKLETDVAVEGVVIKNVQTGAVSTLPAECVFIYVGMQPNVEMIPKDVEVNEGGFIKAGAEMETNVAGFFVAGDVRVKQYRQVATAMGDGVTAACSANHYIENHS